LKSKLSEADLNEVSEPLDILYKVDEALLSDLDPKEIPDDMVSDVDDLPGQSTGGDQDDATGVA
jgi:5'-3' exonuclease